MKGNHHSPGILSDLCRDIFFAGCGRAEGGSKEFSAHSAIIYSGPQAVKMRLVVAVPQR